MSASLVGSEMCIRDRLSQWQKDNQVEESTRQIKLLGWAPGETRAERRSCLLYTSDAADDM
eukprot:9347411-Alexandrium_andersonii.AAC.1